MTRRGVKAPARNSARQICLPLALGSGWIGAVRIHGRLRFLSWPVSSVASSVAPCAPRVFLSGSSLHTSSVYEKDGAEDCSGLTSVGRGPSAPWPRAQARIKLTRVTTTDQSFLRARMLPAAVPCIQRVLKSELRRERQRERKGRREEGGRSWLATVEHKSPRAITYSKL